MRHKNQIYDFYNQPHIKKISTKGYYDEKIKFYEGQLNRITYGSDEKKHILDIACNDGILSKKYFSKYGKVFGIDINKDAINKCKKNGINSKQIDIESYSKSTKVRYDVVIAGDIIEHVFDTDVFLESIKKVLKPNGTLLLTTANVASFGRRIMLLLGKNPFLEYSTRFPNVEINVGHIRYYTVQDMRLQMESLGYKNVQIFGDRINMTEKIYVPQFFAKHVPTLSRYMHVVGQLQ